MMPWFPRDFAAATAGWTFLEKSVYRPLLDCAWMLGYLPTDETRLTRIVGCSEAEFATAWPMVKTKFALAKLESGETVYQNLRLEEHRVESMRLKGRRSEAGRMAVQARERLKREAIAVAEALGNQSIIDRSSIDAPNDDRSINQSISIEHPSSPLLSEESTKNPNLVSEDSSANALSRDSRGSVDKLVDPPTEIPPDWQPNSINREWLVESGMPVDRITEVVAEFVVWARHTKLRKSSRNWQLTFYRNPRVKTAVGSAKSRGSGNGTHQGAGKDGRETAYARAGRKLREWAEDTGLDDAVLA